MTVIKYKPNLNRWMSWKNYPKERAKPPWETEQTNEECFHTHTLKLRLDRLVVKPAV